MYCVEPTNKGWIKGGSKDDSKDDWPPSRRYLDIAL